jgi:hypothetical protein
MSNRIDKSQVEVEESPTFQSHQCSSLCVFVDTLGKVSRVDIDGWAGRDGELESRYKRTPSVVR